MWFFRKNIPVNLQTNIFETVSWKYQPFEVNSNFHLRPVNYSSSGFDAKLAVDLAGRPLAHFAAAAAVVVVVVVVGAVAPDSVENYDSILYSIFEIGNLKCLNFPNSQNRLDNFRPADLATGQKTRNNSGPDIRQTCRRRAHSTRYFRRGQIEAGPGMVEGQIEGPDFEGPDVAGRRPPAIEDLCCAFEGSRGQRRGRQSPPV